ncbi:hypothetical protein PspLS_11799 [Pyricularia sp. CBS 133598]|nr:hypothetical protein PspLS_11799 [Pyricularia sp. CBS 133598]
MSSRPDTLHAPLHPQNEFRLLQLARSWDDDDDSLTGVLHTFLRSDAPHYQPVSYTWGTQEPSTQLLLKLPEQDRLLRFAIRPNVAALLRQIRSCLGSVYIWIDAICINQEDDNEKGHQVRLMDWVYRNMPAFIWLGEPSDNSDLAMDLIDKVTDAFCYCSHQACKHSVCEDKCIVTGKDGFTFPPGLRIPTNWICLNEKHLPEESNTQIVHSIGELRIPQAVECYCKAPVFTTDAVYDQWGNRMWTEFMPEMYADCPYVPMAPRLSLNVIEQREMATAGIMDVCGMAAWNPIMAKLKTLKAAEEIKRPPSIVASEGKSTPPKVDGGLETKGSAGTRKRKAEKVEVDAVKKAKPVRTSKRLRAKKQTLQPTNQI